MVLGDGGCQRTRRGAHDEERRVVVKGIEAVTRHHCYPTLDEDSLSMSLVEVLRLLVLYQGHSQWTATLCGVALAEMTPGYG